MTSSVWTKVAGFRHGNPLLSSVLIFLLVVVVGFLLHLIWTPLAQGYALGVLLLLLAHELRKRVLTDRSSLVWIPSLVAPGLILLSAITKDQRGLLICIWILASVFLLKLRRRSRFRGVEQPTGGTSGQSTGG